MHKHAHRSTSSRVMETIEGWGLTPSWGWRCDCCHKRRPQRLYEVFPVETPHFYMVCNPCLLLIMTEVVERYMGLEEF